MGKAKRKLTIEEKEEIRVLYRTGEWSYDKLAVRFETSKSTIKRTVKAEQIRIAPPPKKTIEVKPPQQPNLPELPFISDPIEFRIKKMADIELSIGNMDIRGANTASMHKLQIEIHDQITQMRKDLIGVEVADEEELFRIIEQAVIGLPPYLKERLGGLVNGDFDNVVTIGSKS